MEEQRASTPTVDERRDPISSQPYNRGPLPYGPSQGAPPSQRYNAGYGRPPPGPHYDSYPLEPYQPPPPGIKDSPSERLVYLIVQ
ncbi:hypothetical protein EVAR_33795_1 [Eumeta japonica]|uniref:Uncharacterized protein n=1 Tax=Eumeta variegata TaxID=151549 RepID=A0A4C1VTF7_EUMVA|nr:hypothetical protein EVAR_33795_1 [Eumeta japonica]